MTDNVETLLETLIKYNEAYRKGEPLVSDHEYDRLLEELKQTDPHNPFLHRVEPEKFEAKKQVRHPIPMLSLEKIYTHNPDKLELFLERIKKEAAEIGVYDIEFKVTPKLDGLAARDEGDEFVTRGNGEVGYEISSAYQKGVIPFGGRGLGIGEIVVIKSYFDEHMANDFEHPRNMVVGIITSDTVNEKAQKALEDEAVLFVPYIMLPSEIVSADNFVNTIESIGKTLIGKTDYPVDGIVVEVTDDRIKDHMGATSHHYRWEIAVKTRGDTTITKVTAIKWQVGRAGTITPVMEVKPVFLSGATIRRVTAHNAGKVREQKIGPGAEIEIIRSGEVIPKLEKVITPSKKVTIPDECPSCAAYVKWENDFLKCTGISCPAQTEQRINHWFKTLGTADWFGIKTIEKLVQKGYDSIEKIYQMKEEEFLEAGFGPVQSNNLFQAILISRTSPVEDWRFLAAFGIPDLGKGDSRKLLSHFKIEDLIDISKEDIEKIHGFGKITSKSIATGIATIKDTMIHMLDLGFRLEPTTHEKDTPAIETPISGKHIVFTGKMKIGTREEMQTTARKLGAIVQTAVSGKTDYLVCGENVGEAKREKAGKTGTKTITEIEYAEIIKGSNT
jgi:DNA ligase (NAD+)